MQLQKISVLENMKSMKTDRRSKYTQMVVKDSLLKLLKKSQLKVITVAELCREAEINRGTFYNHFYDVYDVYESIEDEFSQEIMKKFENIKTYDISSSFFHEIVSYISQNATLTLLIAENPNNDSLLKKIVSHIKNKYVAEYRQQFPALQVELIECIFTYTLSGAIGLITEWLKSDTYTPPKQIADIIEQFSNTIMDNYLKS